MFWLAAVLLITICTLFIALPLLRGSVESDAQAHSDVDFYRAQLAALDKDVARAVISKEEAASAKVEISRRLLEADKRHAQAEAAIARPARPLVAGLVVLVVAGAGFGMYLIYGAPGAQDQPLVARYQAAEDLRQNRPSQAEAVSVAPANPYQQLPEDVALIEQLRQALQSRPDDLHGHQLLVANEARLGRFSEAAAAQAQVIRILGDEATSQHYADQADLMVLAANSYVSPEAEEVLREALQRDPRNGTARFYMGLMLAQIGRGDIAFETWRRLLEESQPDDLWVAPIRSQIMQAARAAGARYELPPEGSAPLRGPDQAAIDAAAEMTPEERRAMVEGMVASLGQRLAEEGGSAQEWAQLIVGRAVLGDTDGARAVLAEAREVFAGNAEALTMFDQAEAQLENAPEASE